MKLIYYILIISMLISGAAALSQKPSWGDLNTSQTFPTNLAMGGNDIIGAGSVTADAVYSGEELQRNQTQAWDVIMHQRGGYIITEYGNGTLLNNSSVASDSGELFTNTFAQFPAGVHLILKSGIYTVSTQSAPPNNSLIESNDHAVIKIANNQNTIRVFYNQTMGNITFRGIVFDGNTENMTNGNRFGFIYASASKDVIIENCVFQNEAGSQCVCLEYPTTGAMIKYNKFYNYGCRVSDGNAIRVTGSSTTEHNQFNSGSLITTTGCDMNVGPHKITHNNFTTLRNGILVACETYDHVGTLIDGNDFNDVGSYPIMISPWTDLTRRIRDTVITNNNIHGGYFGIYVDRAINTKIYSNTITASGSGIYVINTTEFSCSMNTVKHCASYGIKIVDSALLDFFGNFIIGNAVSDVWSGGLHINSLAFGTNNTTIHDNWFLPEATQGYPVYVNNDTNERDIFIYQNIIKAHTKGGITIGSACGNVTVGDTFV